MSQLATERRPASGQQPHSATVEQVRIPKAEQAQRQRIEVKSA